MPEENIFDMSAEAFEEKHPEDVKRWKTQAAEKATAVAADAERQRFAALETGFPDHPKFVGEQFKAGSTVDEAKLAFNAVLTAELTAERKARLQAEETAKAAQNAVDFQASDTEKTPEELEKATAGEPKTFMAAIKAYRAEHKDVSAADAIRACSVAYPDLYAKQRRGEV